jgi:endoglucanase
VENVEEQALDILARLGSQPAVSFHEAGVAQMVKAVLWDLGVAFRTDDFGNILARVPGQRPDAVPLALVAHLDHPGFEAVAHQGDRLVAQALGGVPAASFSPGVPLRVLLPGGQRLPAAIAGQHGADADRQVLIRLDAPQPVPLPCPVVFDLVDFQVDEEFIRMRALDDLAGCGSILMALAIFARERPPGDVYGVFTRAEEVGLVGARLLAEAGTLPQGTLVVSLESSRTLPGAEIGGGPVIRVGDAATTFSADAEAALLRARETLQAQRPSFKVQRQLMSGGTCEASAFALYGYPSTGIAYPLGNYHNGGPEGRIEAEFIHRQDLLGGIELMVAAAHGVPERESLGVRRRLRQMPEEYRQRLRDTAGAV